MSSSQHNSRDLLSISLVGSMRGASVTAFTYPLEVVKNHLQVHRSTTPSSSQVIKDIFREHGLLGFYRGLAPSLVRVVARQIWTWPMVIEIPRRCENMNPYLSQALTGMAIAGVDAAITTPLEKARISLVVNNQRYHQTFQRQDPVQFVRYLWGGTGTQFGRIAAAWSTFLVSQELYRKQMKKYRGKEKLNFKELCAVTVAVAGTVSILSTPFDFINTMKQSGAQMPKEISLRTYYRGARINAIGMIIHNLASISLIEYYSHR